MESQAQQLEHAAELVAQADGLLIGAGAGMGVDSGLPDFRGSTGFWQAYPALQRSGIAFTEIANPAAFATHPALAWGFYGHRLALYRRTAPHAGFQVLRQWASRMPMGARVFTSNVDGHFQAAGFAPDGVVECHGSIHHLQCSVPCGTQVWPADGFAPDVDETQCLLRNAPPRCPHCGALARPNILMFGDWNWIESMSVAAERRLDRWLAEVPRLLVVELGAGTAIPSVRQRSHHAMQAHGAALVRINPREAQTPAGHVGLALGALAGLLAIDALL